ncbi:MAG: hypothetical protein ACRDKI_00005 [Solirubrobacterales bacterium]
MIWGNRFVAALVVAMLVFALSGCGESESQKAADAKASYLKWQAAIADGDAKTACALTTKNFLRQSISADADAAASCIAIVEGSAKYLAKHPEEKTVKVLSATAKGDKVTVVQQGIRSGESAKTKVMLVKSKGGKWQVDAQETVAGPVPAAAKDAYLKYIAAFATGDGATACALATENAKKLFIKYGKQATKSDVTCEQAIKALSQGSSSLLRPTVTGGKGLVGVAVLNVKQPAEQGENITRTVYMQKENDKWLFDHSVDKLTTQGNQPEGPSS